MLFVYPTVLFTLTLVGSALAAPTQPVQPNTKLIPGTDDSKKPLGPCGKGATKTLAETATSAANLADRCSLSLAKSKGGSSEAFKKYLGENSNGHVDDVERIISRLDEAAQILADTPTQQSSYPKTGVIFFCVPVGRYVPPLDGCRAADVMATSRQTTDGSGRQLGFCPAFFKTGATLKGLVKLFRTKQQDPTPSPQVLAMLEAALWQDGKEGFVRKSESFTALALPPGSEHPANIVQFCAALAASEIS